MLLVVIRQAFGVNPRNVDLRQTCTGRLRVHVRVIGYVFWLRLFARRAWFCG